MKLIFWKNFLLLMVLLTSKFDENIHIQSRIFFFFLKNVLKQTWNFFNTKFLTRWKDRNSSYKVRRMLGLFCHFIPLILCYNSVKGFGVTKNSRKKIVWRGLRRVKIKKSFQRQYFTKYLKLTLVLM